VNAVTVLEQLVELGVVLWTEGDRVRFRAPVGALGHELRDASAECRAGLRALVDAGGVLPVDRAAWLEDAVDAFEERAAIMEFDGGLTRDRAEHKAERLVRVDHTRAFVAQLALATVPDAAAVASRP
jgi:hypothetical protein